MVLVASGMVGDVTLAITPPSMSEGETVTRGVFSALDPADDGVGVTVRDDGTLLLSGTNTYTGGTTFTGGIVSVSQEVNLGGPAGALSFNGGTLQITGTSFNSTSRAINWLPGTNARAPAVRPAILSA